MTGQSLVLPLGNGCNNNCIHCQDPHEDCPTFLSTEDIRKKLSALGERPENILIRGGEPTIRDDILEVLSLCKKTVTGTVCLNTNARMFSYKKLCRDMFGSGLGAVLVTIHGHTPKIHDAITRSRGSFQQTIEGVKNILDTGKKIVRSEHVYSSVVLSKYNYKHLTEIVFFLGDLGFSNVEFTYPRIIGNAAKFSDLFPLKSEMSGELTNASEKATELGMIMRVNGFPVCLSRGFLKSNSYLNPHRMFKMKLRDTEEMDSLHGNACDVCAAMHLCPGECGEILARSGWGAFKPLSRKELQMAKKSF